MIRSILEPLENLVQGILRPFRSVNRRAAMDLKRTSGRRPKSMNRFMLEPLEVRDLPAVVVFNVTNTNDSGAGSLREAIIEADQSFTIAPQRFTTNQSTNAINVINFNIPGPGVHTIVPNSELPAVMSATTIDGTTQPGYNGTPLIAINGGEAGTYVKPGYYVEGIRLGSNAGVKGLAVDGFSGDQVLLNGSNNVVLGNYIGTNAGGRVVPRGGQAGISILGGSGNTIGGPTPSTGNLISGNLYGIYSLHSSNTLIEGNILGLDASETQPIGNGYAILLDGAGNDTIGGSVSVDRNVIAANGTGIELTGTPTQPSNMVEILGNAFGINDLVVSYNNVNSDVSLLDNTKSDQVTGNLFNTYPAPNSGIMSHAMKSGVNNYFFNNNVFNDTYVAPPILAPIAPTSLQQPNVGRANQV